jgi:InsA-like protein
MVLISVLCPHCHSDQVIKGGKTKTGQQRYKVISQNEYPDSICSGRVNQYVPFGQKRMAF